MTTSRLFRQDQAHSPAFFSVSTAMGHHGREPERSIS